MVVDIENWFYSNSCHTNEKKIIILLNYSYVNQFIQCALNGVNDLELKVESLPHMCDNTSRNILS